MLISAAFTNKPHLPINSQQCKSYQCLGVSLSTLGIGANIKLSLNKWFGLRYRTGVR